MVHVGGGGPDVLGGDVRTVQGLDDLGRLNEASFTQVRAPVVDHDRLAAAEVEARHGRLQAHGAGQAHHVVQRLGESPRIALQPHAAERGAEDRRVDGDDQPKPGRRVLAHDDLLVIVVSELGRRDDRWLGRNGHLS